MVKGVVSNPLFQIFLDPALRGLEPPKPPPSAACELILVCVCVLMFELQSYSGGLLYDGQYIANTTSTIVVTINYRLGAMGFLVYGEGQDMPQGNYGLRVSGVPSGWVCVEGSGALKVSLSLEWVHSWMGVVLGVDVPTGQLTLRVACMYMYARFRLLYFHFFSSVAVTEC